MGDYVYGIDVENLEQCVSEALIKKNFTLAVAEGFSGGELSSRFSILPSANAFFRGSVTVFTDDAKYRLLGIDPDVILTEGSASTEVTAEMAENVRRLLNADFGIAVTGLTEEAENSSFPAGTGLVALATENETFVKTSEFGTARSSGFIRRMAGNTACDMMRRYLNGLNVL